MIQTKLWMLVITIILCGTSMLTSCNKDGEIIYQPNPNEEQPAATPLVTVIYGPNGLGDRSYCDLIYKGVEAAGEKYGVRTLQLSPESETQGLAYIETMFQQMENLNDTVRRLFVTPSPVYDAYIRANNHRLEKNPNADLLYMETTTPLEGKGSTFYIDYYGAMYMGGGLSCSIYHGLLTLVLANPYTQSVVEAGKGFEAGFHEAPRFQRHYNVDFHKRYLSEEPVGGFTIADTTALRIINEENEYIRAGDYLYLVPICGGAMHSFIRAFRLNTFNSDYYIGIDGDLTADKVNCAFSVVKHIDKVMEDYIGMWLQGTMPKHQTLGLKDNATDVVLGYSMSTSDNIASIDLDSLRQVAIRKEGERYGK